MLIQGSIFSGICKDKLNTIRAEEFSKRKALEDAQFCIQNACYGKRFNNLNPSTYHVHNPNMYLNTSDNIKGINKTMPKGKSVLTVASSGDYIIESSLNGADNIVSFDINEFQYYIATFKLWALQTLSYEEFKSFFLNEDSPNFLSSKLMEKVISKFHGEPAYYFFDEIRKQRAEEENFLRNEKSAFLELVGEVPDELLKRFLDLNYSHPMNTHYLFKTLNGNKFFTDFLSSEEKYLQARKKVQEANISFVISDARNVNKLVSDQQFDSIYLSNISAFLRPYEFLTAINNLNPLLNNEGAISSYYQCMLKLWFEAKKRNRDYRVADLYLAGNPGNSFYYTEMLAGYGLLVYSEYKTETFEHSRGDIDRDVDLKIYRK